MSTKPFVFDPDKWVPGTNMVVSQLNYSSPIMHLPIDVDHLTYNSCLLDTIDLHDLNDDCLVRLEIYASTIRELKGLPPSLEYLWIQYSKIDRIELPPNLKTLVVHCEDDIEFTEFPVTLNVIVLSGRGLQSLTNLPPNLQILECSSTNLSVLPELPPTLTRLDCSSNQLKTLPVLPDTLQYIDCSCNTIEGPIHTLPRQLLHFDCSHNKITTLPTLLPPGLRKVDCSNNLLTVIPERLPVSLHMLNFARNPIKRYPYIYNSPGLIFISKMHPLCEDALRGFALPDERDEREREDLYESGEYTEHELLRCILELQQQADCRVFVQTIKEELMVYTWHPSRIEAWCGVNFSDDSD
jgi:Leucine-rich repeat (LRR) protein